jgi:hypothetical protein
LHATLKEDSVIRSPGLTVGTWAKVQYNCEIDYLVSSEEVELSFGRDFTLIADAEGLTHLLAKGKEALTELIAAEEAAANVE